MVVRLGIWSTIVCLTLVSTSAWAQSQEDVDAVVTITGGPLSIAAPDSVDLGPGTPGTSLSAALGTVTVTDQRGEFGASWGATVTSSDFTTGGATQPETVPANAIDYWSGPVTGTVGEGLFLPGQAAAENAVPLGEPREAFSKSGGDGGNAASWVPSINIQIPMSAVAGGYTGTVTHSVA